MSTSFDPSQHGTSDLHPGELESHPCNDDVLDKSALYSASTFSQQGCKEVLESHPCNDASASTFSQQGCKEVAEPG